MFAVKMNKIMYDIYLILEKTKLANLLAIL